ncbi:Anthranilate phosphoribosyltransferase 2 [bacterium HR35]|nr:Anthranilate phosphoribosyltransferase 2 [bacterium HR35]
MMDENIIKKIVKFTQKLTSGKDFNKAEAYLILKLINNSNRNFKVYEGIILLYYFSKFKEFPNKDYGKFANNEILEKCVFLLNGGILSPLEIGNLFLDILTYPNDPQKRDILMGYFYGALWSFMNNSKNLEIAVNYGLAIIKSAFSLDNFDIDRKIKLTSEVKVINLAGSGKKETKLLNISSMNAIITAAVGKVLGKNILITKTASRSTSSVTGSTDIFESAGINLNLPIEKMIEIMLKTGVGIFDINRIVPKLNQVYNGRLYDVQVFAGLVGGAAIVNPIDADLINYGLTRGSTQLCLAILSKLYPKKNILVIQGKNYNGKPVIDQVSINGNTEIAQSIKGQIVIKTVTPKDFGFCFKPIKYIESRQNTIENLSEFIKLLAGKSNESIKQVVAMEVALNLLGLEIVNDLKYGANLAVEVINSGEGIRVIEDLIYYSGGDVEKFNRLTKLLLCE